MKKIMNFLVGTYKCHSELFGAIWTQFGLVWSWSWSWSWKKEEKNLIQKICWDKNLKKYIFVFGKHFGEEKFCDEKKKIIFFW